MNELQRGIIQRIINAESTIEKTTIFVRNKNELKDIQIVLFNEDASNFDGFEDKSFGNYNLCGIGDYNKVWIIDNKTIDKVELCVKRKAYFDINVISRIDDYLNGNKLIDKSDLIMYLNYIKDKNFELEIGNSVIERLSKTYDERLFKRSMESFYKYAMCEKFDEDVATVTYDITEFEQFYNRCLSAESMSRNDVLVKQYDFILCLMMKAIIIKADNKCYNKVDALVEFCLNELKCVMVNEIYLLSLYLKNKQEVMKNIFAKFHSSIKNGLENAVRNSTWDIYHARMVEQNMSLYDNVSHKIVFPYFATNDKGVKDYWVMNPRIMTVIDAGVAINIYKHNVGDIEPMLVDKELFVKMIDERQQEKRKSEINDVDIAAIKECLISELRKVNI